MERPIILKAHEVRGILDGRQTQLRRIISPQPITRDTPFFCDPELLCGYPAFDWKSCEMNYPAFVRKCPFGQVGDRLWGRECFSGPYSWHECPPSLWVGGEHSLVPPLWYWADGNPDDGDWTKPKSSTQMPRHFSRILLEIASLRVERLQDISQDDAKASGAKPLFTLEEVLRRPDLEPHSRSWDNFLWHGHVGDGITAKQSDTWDFQYSGYAPENPRGSFSSMWEMDNGAGSWDANPWVWVVEFKRVIA